MTKNKNLSFNDFELKHTTLHVIAAISMENGLEPIIVTNEPVTWAVYCRIVPRCTPNSTKALFFGDNATWHDTPKTLGFVRNWGSDYCFGVAWKPFLNPIEMVFSILRRKYNTLRLEDLIAGRKTD